jgi:uncharacterized protein (TIGR03435 family)
MLRVPYPDLYAALLLPTEQLGLNLDKQKAQIDVLVVDHIGTLTEN